MSVEIITVVLISLVVLGGFVLVVSLMSKNCQVECLQDNYPYYNSDLLGNCVCYKMLLNGTYEIVGK